ncbi:hypothetical protein D3870_13510 [Noviherbaspirillum cavernae]|uniref:Uncharacterized protein n=1 Tax=Noviherbaspirillum cavernae TaxID=2320862 RepID=A0A418X352_9BURK|nr:hypothetical protein [Noviherbaspirillum cavernae]RJG06879.1 hypothetical protein D3870_13510 [Noviherbaspirillum cavernae]
MSALLISQPSPVRSYVANVGHAGRALIAALLGIGGGAATADNHVAGDTDAQRLSLFRLYSLASPYDSVMPDLAQELRYIATRAN